MIDISNDLAFPLVIILIAASTWASQMLLGRDRHRDSRFYFHFDHFVSMAACLAIAFFIIYLTIAWASLLSNLEMLETHKRFQFFRNAVDQSDRDVLLETRRVSIIVLIAHVAVMWFVALVVNFWPLCAGRDDLWSGWPDLYFALLALGTALALIPYYFQYKYGAPTSLIPRNWSEEAGRYLDLPSTTPQQLEKQWNLGPGYMVFTMGLLLLDLCILCVVHVFLRIVSEWLARRIPPNRDEEAGNELQTLTPSARPEQAVEPIPAAPRPAAGSSNQAQVQAGLRSERNPFDDANEISDHERPAQARQHPNRNPFGDENEIEVIQSPAPSYRSTI